MSTKVFNVKGEVHTVEMVLVDEEGNKMLGGIINEHWQNFKSLIELNSTILITKASLAENRATNKFMGNHNKMKDYISSNPDKTNVVIILQFEKTWATNKYVYSKLFIDEDIKDIISFKQRLIEQTSGLTNSSQKSIVSSVNCSVEDDFLIKIEFNNIAEVHIKTVRSVVILGTIKYVPPTQKWYYLSCNTCPKGVRKIDTKCNNDKCKDKESSLINRFRILIRVKDPTGIIDLTLWDMEAVKILNVSANDLVESIIKA
ncbi:uncharacterized protein LOC143604046 [Bidens hawaiensis]|uniref:uncharacterized protein LOC143604046 n=1 Tax=Bidens hawaiensis TaxID=980011 RepID=UPI00404B408E